MTKNKLKEIVKLVQQDPEFIKAVSGALGKVASKA